MIVMIVWVLISYGMSTILVYGSIFEQPRGWIINKSKFFGALIQCMLCTSTWVGFFLSIFLASPASEFFEVGFLPSIFFDGMFSAGSVWAVNAIVEFFEENRINKN